MQKLPNSRRNLDLSIQRTFGADYLNVRAIMANVIVAQMLPGGAVKGGSAIKFRFGDTNTRFSDDLDTVYNKDLEGFISSLEDELTKGWNGFTGRVVPKPPAKPKNIPPHYVMQPFEIKLLYKEKSWLTVKLEVVHNEIGDADSPEWGISSDIIELFESVGLPAPDPVPLMPLHHQIAQKLHGLSELGSKRAHDLIDLQLIVQNEAIDYPKTRATCERLFAYRNAQTWPPVITKGYNWDSLYLDQLEEIDISTNVDDAIIWANKLIASIKNA